MSESLNRSFKWFIQKHRFIQEQNKQLSLWVNLNFIHSTDWEKQEKTRDCLYEGVIERFTQPIHSPTLIHLETRLWLVWRNIAVGAKTKIVSKILWSHLVTRQQSWMMLSSTYRPLSSSVWTGRCSWLQDSVTEGSRYEAVHCRGKRSPRNTSCLWVGMSCRTGSSSGPSEKQTQWWRTECKIRRVVDKK